MLRNYFKIAVRNLVKFKLYSAINIAGLSIGLACVILISLFIRDELSFDRFHQKAGRIYRVYVEFEMDGRTVRFAGTQAPLAPALLAEFPEVIHAVRFADRYEELVTAKDRQFWEKGVMLADPEVFATFTFPLSKGDPRTALDDPTSVVLSETMARKYFTGEDAMGKELRIGDNPPVPYKVSGVMKDVPPNSQLQFDFLVSFANQRGNIGWGMWNYTTYVELRPDASPAALEAKLPELVGKHMGEETRARNRLRLQPLTRIHLHSNLRSDLPTNGDLSHLYIFSAAAFLILLLACINFVNLVTARSAVREKEVGLRKVVGASRRQLVFQFLGEALLLSGSAFLLSLPLAQLLLPVFNVLAGKHMAFDILGDVGFVALLAAMMIAVGVLAGAYPAFVVSRFRPASIFRQGRGEGASLRPSVLRRVLVVAQFVVSTIFLSSTLVIRLQMDYVRNKNLGYDKEHMIVLPIYYEPARARADLLKAEIVKSPLVLGASATAYLPSKGTYRQNVWWEGLLEDAQNVYIDWISADENFIRTLGLEVTAGRDFSADRPGDRGGAYILNEAASRLTGVKDPVGMPFKIVEPGTVIGVVRDFNFKSLHEEIQPMALYVYPQAFSYLLVRVRSDRIAEAVRSLKRTWEEIVPSVPFSYSFFDEDFARIYSSETRLMTTFNYVAGLALFVACLGLFGLASFTALRRGKEIGIRKVLGASVGGITMFLSKEFLGLVLLANLFAWPIAYFPLTAWLRKFAYRTGLGLWIFAAAGLLSLAVALAAVSYQSVKAALANPGDTLRYE